MVEAAGQPGCASGQSGVGAAPQSHVPAPVPSLWQEQVAVYEPPPHPLTVTVKVQVPCVEGSHVEPGCASVGHTGTGHPPTSGQVHTPLSQLHCTALPVPHPDKVVESQVNPEGEQA
jgi:hypothetical protein